MQTARRTFEPVETRPLHVQVAELCPAHVRAEDIRTVVDMVTPWAPNTRATELAAMVLEIYPC